MTLQQLDETLATVAAHMRCANDHLTDAIDGIERAYGARDKVPHARRARVHLDMADGHLADAIAAGHELPEAARVSLASMIAGLRMQCVHARRVCQAVPGARVAA